MWRSLMAQFTRRVRRAGKRPEPLRDGSGDSVTDHPLAPPQDRSYDGIAGAFYALYMDSSWLQYLDSWLLGLNLKAYQQWVQQQLEGIQHGPVLEVPIGNAPFFHTCLAYRRLPWIGIDLSFSMLRRLQKKCRRRGVEICLIQADVNHLPIRSESIHQVVSLFGLHCFRNKQQVVSELHRCLHPHGYLTATTLTVGSSKRADAYYRLYERDGSFAVGHDPAQLRALMHGFQESHSQVFGAAFAFTAQATPAEPSISSRS